MQPANATRERTIPSIGSEDLAEGLMLVRASTLKVIRLQLAMERRDRRVALEAVDDLVALDRSLEDYLAKVPTTRDVGVFGNLLELDTIAAVIIGGASFLGGRGHLGHAVIGAIMIGVIRNALNLLNVDIYFQLIVIGVVIVIAVECDVLRNYLEGRVRVAQAGKSQ